MTKPKPATPSPADFRGDGTDHPPGREGREKWPLSRFRVYAENPREHSDSAVDQFAKAIQRFGFRIPVLVKSTGEVIDGHFRLKAAEKAGMAEVPIELADDMSEADIRAFRLSVNRMPELATWAQDPLLRELEALQAGGEKLEADGAVGFELEEFDAPITTEDWDFTPVHDVFVVTITGSLPLEDEVRERLKGIPGITIEASSLQRTAP